MEWWHAVVGIISAIGVFISGGAATKLYSAYSDKRKQDMEIQDADAKRPAIVWGEFNKSLIDRIGVLEQKLASEESGHDECVKKLLEFKYELGAVKGRCDAFEANAESMRMSHQAQAAQSISAQAALAEKVVVGQAAVVAEGLKTTAALVAATAAVYAQQPQSPPPGTSPSDSGTNLQNATNENPMPVRIMNPEDIHS